jgi:DNA polymerase-4
VAERIKAGLRQNVGTHITCSIGVAPNTLLAKMAADMKKPDGLTILRQEDLPGPLLDLPLTDIPGVGENMHRRLQRARIRTMADLWATAPKHARKIWASVQGERLWYWLHGYDFEGPPTHPVMIGHSRMLDPALRPQAQARLMARRLMTKATYRLRRAGYFACGVGLSTRSIHGLRWAGEQRIAPARDPLTFLNILENLWAGMRNDLAPHAASGLSLKKVSVVLTGLKQAHDITDDLLIASSPKAVLDLKKREALAAALDHLQTKYRRETVCLGVPPKTLGGHVGTKIAFARVPDAEEFWC